MSPNRANYSWYVSATTLWLTVAAMVFLLFVGGTVLAYQVWGSQPGLSAAEAQQQQQHIQALTAKLAELQSRQVVLEGLVNRLSQFAGIKEAAATPAPSTGQGGPLVHVPTPSLISLLQQTDAMKTQLDQRSDELAVLEALLVSNSTRRHMLPSSPPADNTKMVSNFGTRLDPFTGMRAFHEGVDFSVPVGSPVYAAAAGRVLQSGWAAEYGHLIELDHGNGLSSRYAHNSRLLVQVGDVVRRGQQIAESGNSGRSTGAHLHFEIRLHGAAQNPLRYLNANNRTRLE